MTLPEPPDSARQAVLWDNAVGLLLRGVPITLVRIEWDAVKARKRINPAFNPPKNWHQQALLTPDLVSQLIARGANAYLYRLPDDVWVVDADTPGAVALAMREFGTPPAVATRKGGHWLFHSDGPLELEGSVFDAHQPRQLYGPGSYYPGPDGVAEYVGAVPDLHALPAPPEQLRGSGLARRRVSAGPAMADEPSGFFTTPPATPDQAKAAIDAKLTVIEQGRGEPSGGRDRVMAAAFLMGGYLHTGWYSWEEAEAVLLAACTRCWGAADDDDAKWIEQGLTDGDRPANRLPAEKRVALSVQESIDAEGDYPDVFTDEDYDGSRELPTPTLGAFGGTAANLYPDKVHWFQGESGSGKTWVALALVVEVVAAGERAWIIDYENSRAEFAGRLKALGITREQLRRVTYTAGGDLLYSELRGRVELSGKDYGLVVVDGVTSALSHAGKSGRDEQEFGTWFDQIPAKARMAVCIDHVTKAIDDRRGMAIGTQAKQGRVDVAYEVFCSRPFSRGTTGEITMTVQKDRHGGLPLRKGQSFRIGVESAADGLTVRLGASAAGFFEDANSALFGALLADGFSAGSSANDLLKAARERGSGFKATRKGEMLEAYKAYVNANDVHVDPANDLGNQREPGLTSVNAFANA